MSQIDPDSLSKVVPVLRSVVICDVACIDPSTNKKNLIGIFDRINVSALPAARQFGVYMKFADAEGNYQVSARFVRAKDQVILGELQVDMSVADRLATGDLVFNLPKPLRFDEAGRYEIQVEANGVYIGGTNLDVRLLEDR